MLPASRVRPDQVLVEHRAAAVLTRLDVDALDAFAEVLRAAQVSLTDHELDRAAAALAALLSLLPYTHPLTVAARCGLEVGDARREHRHTLTDVSHAIAAAPFWRGYSSRWLPYEVLAARRAEPGRLAGGTAA